MSGGMMKRRKTMEDNMKTSVLNDALVFAYPDDFEEMSKEEISSMANYGEAPQFVIRNAQRHMVVSAGYKVINGFSAMMLNTADMAKKTQSEISKVMKDSGYELICNVKENIADKTAEGFRYRYQVQDVDMSSESLILKEGKVVYYIQCYYRTAMSEDSLPVFDQMLKNSSWK
jgi:hypothetical protein